jgi:hypothetical protein
MSLVTMSGEPYRIDPPKIERDIVIQTREVVWLEVRFK